jgi:hypothetical protein
VIVADSVAEALLGQMVRTPDDDKSGSLATYARWVEIWKRAKKERSDWLPQLPLEMAAVDCIIMTKGGTPPTTIMLSDWEAFVAWVRGKSTALAKYANKLEYVRIKKDTTVVCRSELRGMREDVLRGIEIMIQKYLRKKTLKLEVLFSD